MCIYIFGSSCSVTENSLCVQVLRSPILAALLHGTRVVGVSQTAALSRGRHLYSARRPSRWALAHILVCDIIAMYHRTFCMMCVCRILIKITYLGCAQGICRYFSYSVDDFEVFRPARATNCTDGVKYGVEESLLQVISETSYGRPA